VRVLATPYAVRSAATETVTVENLKDLIQVWAATPDADEDGYDKYSFGGDDCDDWRPDVNPGAPEVCDLADNDCDGIIDEGFQTLWYRDVDADSYGDPNQSVAACNPPGGYVSNNQDCNDSNSVTFPNAPEVCDGVDNNCNDTVDEGFTTTWYRDQDGDGHGDPADQINSCTQPPGYVALGTDCADESAAIYPFAPEICDGLDNDCDSFIDPPGSLGCTPYYFDNDGDGWGSNFYGCLCTNDEFTSPLSGDCDDGNFNVNPDAVEICDDMVDNDCDGLTDAADPDCP
jgi:hypothetical protein